MKGWKIVALGMLGAAATGLSIFGLLAWRAVRLETKEPSVALAELDRERARQPGPPLFALDAAGRLSQRSQPERAGATAERLHVLAWRKREGRLVRAQVPLWFLELKGPAVALALRGTGLDPEAAGLTPEAIRRHGKGLLLDASRPGGDRVLVWTE
jgi:hypothetical protein